MKQKVVKSVASVTRLFEEFAVRRSPASAEEVSSALGLSRSSTLALLVHLFDRGWLSFDIKSARYAPTRRAMVLGQGIAPGEISIGLARGQTRDAPRLAS